MVVNKNKVNDNALKFIQKGQIKKAIREYEKILAEDPGDVRTLLKKGDLQVRINEKNEAIDTYLRVANAYSQQGFHLKAVAVYKQILKIDTNRIDVNLNLADEYQNLGIVGDAMSHLQVVAAYYDQQGMVRESLDILRRIVDLDPDNVASRIKLAELYSREGMTNEAVEEFSRAAEDLKSANRVEDFIKVAERLIYHDSSNLATIKEVANIYLQRGDTKRALGKLQICFKADPRDLPTLNMLALAFQDLNQLSKTVSVYKEMAKIYQEQGAQAEMQQVYARVLEIAPGDPDANLAIGGGLAPVIESATEASVPMITSPTAPLRRATPEPAPPPVAEGFEPQTDDQFTIDVPRPPEVRATVAQPVDATREAISRLLTETDVYIKYGLTTKAFEHLNRVFEIDPNNIEAHNKLKDLYLGANQMDHAAQELYTLVHLCSRIGRQEDARSYLRSLLTIAPSHPDGLALAAQLDGADPFGAAGMEMPGEDAEDALLEIDDEEAEAVDVAIDLDDSAGLEMAVESVDELPLDDPDIGESSPEGDWTQPAADAPILLDDLGDRDDPAAFAGEDALLPEAESDSGFEADAFGDDLPEEVPPEFQASSAEELFESDIAAEDLLGVSPDNPLDLLAGPDGIGLLDTGDEDEEEDEGEVSTRIAMRVDLEALNPAQPVREVPREVPDEPVPLDSDYAFGEDTADVSSVDTGIYEPEQAEDLLTVDAELESEIEAERGAEIPLMPSEELTVEKPAPEITLTGPRPAAVGEPELIPFDGEDEFGDLPEEPAVVPPPLPTVGPPPLPVAGPPPLPARPAERVAAPVEEPEEEPEPQPAVTAPEPSADVADADAAEVDSELEDGLEEVDFFIQQNLMDEATDALRNLQASHPGHPEVEERAARLERLRQGGTPVAALSSEDLQEPFDLATEIEREAEADADFAAPLDDFQYSAEDVLSEFRKGVARVVEKEDSATHFDLGIAYKEMGLVDDACAEFQIAAQNANRAAAAMTMIGLCMVEKGQFSDAINRFKDALHQPSISELEATGVYYEMGQAYEALHDANEALFYFKKVFKRDPKFREVAAKLKGMTAGEARSPGEEDSPAGSAKSSRPASSKNKISYM